MRALIAALMTLVLVSTGQAQNLPSTNAKSVTTQTLVLPALTGLVQANGSSAATALTLGSGVGSALGTAINTSGGLLGVTQAASTYAPLNGSGASGTWSISISGSAGAAPWSGITGKPTTLAGYGITDALSASSAASTYAPLNAPSFTGGATLAGGLAIPSGVPGTTSNVLYNNGGNLYFNGIALATGSSVSGTPGYLSYFTGSSSLGNSGIYQSGGNFGFGTTGVGARIHSVVADGNNSAIFSGATNLIRITPTTTENRIGSLNSAQSAYATLFIDGAPVAINSITGGDLIFGSTSTTGALRAFAVDGYTVATFSGASNLVRVTPTSASVNIGSLNSVQTAYAPLKLDGAPLLLNSITGGYVGINTASPGYALDVNGAVNASVLRVGGAVAGNLWLTNIVTPEMYGAGGAGTTDDTSSVSAAFASGKTVYLPGKYKITSALAQSIAASSGFRMFGDGSRSQFILSGASTGITFTLNYTGNYVGQNGQLLLKDFAIVETTVGAGTPVTSSAGYGMLNIKAASLSGTGFAGITAFNAELDNVMFLSDGAGWNYTALFLQDVRYLKIGAKIANVTGSAGGSGGVDGSIGIAYRTTNTGSYANAPTRILIDHTEITSGAKGISFIASGATSGTMDPQGVWVTDSQVIGQSNISIDLNATDANNAEWHIERDTLNATNVCVNFNGIGEILATSNVCVISSNSGAGFQVATGNTQWTAGHIANNNVTGAGGGTAVVRGTYNLGSGITNGFLRIDGNTSMNAGGGYPISGSAVSKGTNF